MVVISAALVNKNGKVLLARQFLDITRSQVEGLLSSFVRMIDRTVQHTYIDNDSARFVYLPFEDLYLVVITSKDSNIVEDLETLRLLYKIIQHYCPFGLDEGNILKNSFDIIFGFDDVISQGYRESITLSQMITYTEMESAEEKLHKEKQKALMQEAKEMSKRKQMELDKKRVQESRERPAETRRNDTFERENMSYTARTETSVQQETVKTDETFNLPPSNKKPTKGMVLSTRKRSNRGET